MQGYIDYILNNAQRVLTQVDRDPDSLSFGSCDRNFWHLKIRDFSSAILQQTSLTLALLYKYNFEGNIYYNNHFVRDWSIGALRYLSHIQLPDGSFNEYYPFEHGYPPTAFLLFSGCKTYQILQLQDDGIMNTLEKTGAYLSSHSETSAYNQEFASIAGLYLLYEITGKEAYHLACKTKLRYALEHQSMDGWFPEQGGADIGYSSVALDMLAEYYWHSKDETVREPINKLISFLQYFVHPDQTIGGEYGSRNTTYLMPNGFATMELLGNEAAAAINHFIYEKIDLHTHFMNSVDERYLSHYVLHSFLRALIKIQSCEMKSKTYQLPCFQPHYHVFEHAGLVTMCNDQYYVVCAPSKGGIFKVFDSGKEVAGDFGYRHFMKPGVISTTNWLDPEYKIEYGENEVKITGYFTVVKQKEQNPIYHLGLVVTSFLFGKKINTFIKKILLFTKKHEQIKFIRNIKFQTDTIFVQDYFENNTGSPVVIKSASNMSLRLVASGKFFSNSDLHVHNDLLQECDKTKLFYISIKRDESGQFKRKSWME